MKCACWFWLRQRGSVAFQTATRHQQVEEVTNNMWSEGNSQARASDNVTHHCDAFAHRLRARCAAGGSISFTLSEKKPRLRRPRCTASNGLGARSLSLFLSLSPLLRPAFSLVPPPCMCRVLTGSVWADQLPRCKDRSSPVRRRAEWLPGSSLSLQRMWTQTVR